MKIYKTHSELTPRSSTTRRGCSSWLARLRTGRRLVRPCAGVGHVQKCRGQYTRAIANGCTVYTLLFETLGGFSPDVCQLLKELAEVRDNRLSKAE